MANALVELYRHGDSMGRTKIVELATHPDPRFRLAIAWAIGELASAELIPVLRTLEHDEKLAVRLRAGRTLKQLKSIAA